MNISTNRIIFGSTAPPGEEDEEEGLRKDYAKSQEKETNAHTHFERNGQQSGYKPRRAGTSTSGGSTSGYASSGSRSHRDESAGSPSQPKIIFNEEEYTRITTPRQDVLFKKGYLSRKKPWTGNASTSATPSTTESQSASHSTAGDDRKINILLNAIMRQRSKHEKRMLKCQQTCFLPSRPS